MDNNRELGFTLIVRNSRRYPAEQFTDTYYADDIAITSNTLKDANTLLQKIESAENILSLTPNSDNTDLNLSTGLKIIFFRDAVESVLVYGSVTWTLTTSTENNMYVTYTRMIHDVTSKSQKDHL